MIVHLFLSLVCAVSYASLTGEKMYFRKFFKFQVFTKFSFLPLPTPSPQISPPTLHHDYHDSTICSNVFENTISLQ